MILNMCHAHCKYINVIPEYFRCILIVLYLAFSTGKVFWEVSNNIHGVFVSSKQQHGQIVAKGNNAVIVCRKLSGILFSFTTAEQ